MQLNFSVLSGTCRAKAADRLTDRSPRVSVVIPNYNYARFLDQRIQTVLNQTYQDFEVILLDDASTDCSREVIAKYESDPRVRVQFNDRNSGSAFKQWNRGVSQARGEYVWIAESDDYADPRLLEALVGVLDRNPQVGLAYCQSQTVSPSGQILGTQLALTDDMDKDRWLSDFVANGRDECRKYLIRRCTIPNASGVVFRRSAYQQVGGAIETLRQPGDWLTWAKLALVSDISFVAEPLNYFRQHDTEIRTSVWKTGQMITEFYYVMGFIAQHVAVDRSALQEARTVMRAAWLTPKNFCRWSYGRHLQTLFVAVRIDPTVIFPFMRASARYAVDALSSGNRGLMRRFKSVLGIFR